MRESVKRLLVIALGISVIVGSAGVGLAVDTTDSTDVTNAAALDEQSDWADDGSTVITGFNASADNYSNVSFRVGADNASSDFEISVSHDGVQHLSLDDGSSAFTTVTETVDPDGTPGSGDEYDVHSFNISHDRLETLPGSPGENTTITANITNYNADGSVNSTAEFDVTFTFAADHSVLYLANGTSTFDDDVEIDEQDAGYIDQYVWGLEDADVPDHYTLETTKNTSSNGTVDAYLGGDMAGNYSDVAEDAEPESGDLMLSMAGLADDGVVPVYYEEAGDVIDTDDDTYGVYHEDDNRVTYHNLEEGEEIDLVLANHNAGALEGIGFRDLWSSSAFGPWQAASAAW